MKISLNWIQEYADITGISPKDYAEAMTLSGSKVEGFAEVGEAVQNVVIGKILEKEKHPDADKLWICKVDVGTSEPLQIVTAAQNMEAGDTVAVALHGATLPGGITIKTGKLRGVVSQGMFCSHEELGLALSDIPGAAEDGIIVFPEAYAPGTNVKKVVGLDDVVVDFEITSNRPDCLSAIGLGRETAATFGKPFVTHTPKATGNDENINDFIKVQVQAPEKCTRYIARGVKNIRIAPSPRWMRDRLTASGIRPINNIVDITNYVMLEYGQPMHAFDRRYLKGGEIIVRCAAADETITTLDGVVRKLDSDMLVIADATRAVAVAGVMGGENSEIQSDTTEVIFESAMFHGPSVRRAAKRLGLRTESSARFEKGLDSTLSLAAVNRACELVELLDAGTVIGGMVDIYPTPSCERVLPLDADKINQFLGTSIPRERMEEILTAIGFTVKGDKISVPTFRADVEEFADVAEEIARFYGYTEIPATALSSSAGIGGRSKSQAMEEKIADMLSVMGYYEVMTSSFTERGAAEKLGRSSEGCIFIKNPLGEENAAMRDTLLHTNLEVLAHNANQRIANVRTFEIGKIYKDLDEKTLAKEPKMLFIGGYHTDFYAVKGDLEALFASLGVSSVRFETAPENATFHPGKTAAILIGEEEAGIFGAIHPEIAARYGLETEVFAAEIALDAILANAAENKTYKTLARFPAVTRDLAFLMDDTVQAGKVYEVIKKYAGGRAEEIVLFDIYKGKQVPEGKKSMAYKITFRAQDKTLSEQDVSRALDKIVRMLEKELGASLR